MDMIRVVWNAFSDAVTGLVHSVVQDLRALKVRLSPLSPVLSCLSVVRPLLDVVDQGEQLPLAVNFALPAQGEAIETLVMADVAKDRFDGGEAATILLFALMTVDALAHRLGMRRFLLAREHGDLSHFGDGGLAQALGA